MLIFYRNSTPHNNIIKARRQELNDYMQYHIQNINGETFVDRPEGNNTYYTPKNKQSKVINYCYRLAKQKCIIKTMNPKMAESKVVLEKRFRQSGACVATMREDPSSGPENL